MNQRESRFTFKYDPGTIHFGRGRTADLSEILAEHGCEGALVVCGRNVGSNDAVMQPLKDGLDNRLAAVFAETTPEKSIETALDGVDLLREVDADVIIGVGGGSSLDVATAMNALSATGSTLTGVQEQLVETGSIERPEDPASLTTLIQIPTTFAGADLSTGGGVSVPMPNGETIGTGIGDNMLMPDALLYDPNLFETTPSSILSASAMNGFDKGIEAIYSRYHTAITDATAIRGISQLTDALPCLGSDETRPQSVMERAVVGIILVQYGISTRSALKISVIHAFGHALRRQFGIQQGTAHAVMAPHVLADLLERGYGRPDILADALEVATPEDSREDRAAAIVEQVAVIRDSLGLPARLREVDGVDQAGLDRAAKLTTEDHLLANGPVEYDPTRGEVKRLLKRAW